MNDSSIGFKISAGVSVIFGIFSSYYGIKYLIYSKKPIVSLGELEKYRDQDVYIEGITQGIEFVNTEEENKNKLKDIMCVIKKHKIFGQRGDLQSKNYSKSLVINS